jgi:hypothetical protein
LKFKHHVYNQTITWLGLEEIHRTTKDFGKNIFQQIQQYIFFSKRINSWVFSSFFLKNPTNVENHFFAVTVFHVLEKLILLRIAVKVTHGL